MGQPRPGEDFFTIRNRNFFVSTDEYVFEWRITSSMGATLGSGTFEVPRTEAGACTECRVGYKAPRPESGVDYWLDIVYRLKEDKPYALRGFEAGRYQFALPAAAPVRAAAARSAVVSRTERSVTLTAGSVTATVDAATGYLSGYAVRGCELMRSPLVPNFWRASTDNDRRGWRTRERMGAWRTMPERLKLESLNAADGAVTAVVCGGGVRLALRYRLAADGELAVSYDLRIADTLPEPLRIGLQALWSAGSWTAMSTAAAVPERIMPTGRKAPCSGSTPAVRPISVPPISIRRSAATAATSTISSLGAKAAE